jgi:hypothetical protein
MKKILLMTVSILVLAYGENVSTDTVQLSKNFMKALIAMDEKTIDEIKHPYAGSRLSKKYFLDAEYKALKASSITPQELKYTVETGKNDKHLCVIVQSVGTRKTSYGLLPIHWRLGFEKSENKENLKLLYLDSINEANGYNDNGCW